jgi:hypothetical protein
MNRACVGLLGLALCLGCGESPQGNDVAGSGDQIRTVRIVKATGFAPYCEEVLRFAPERSLSSLSSSLLLGCSDQTVDATIEISDEDAQSSGPLVWVASGVWSDQATCAAYLVNTGFGSLTVTDNAGLQNLTLVGSCMQPPGSTYPFTPQIEALFPHNAGSSPSR